MWDEVNYNHTSCLESIVKAVWTLSPPSAQIAQSINLHPLIAQIIFCHLVSTSCNSATSLLIVCDGSLLTFEEIAPTLVTLLTTPEHRLACHRFAFFHLPAITYGRCDS